MPVQALQHQRLWTPAEAMPNEHSLHLTGHTTPESVCLASSWVSGEAHTGTGTHPGPLTRTLYTGHLVKPSLVCSSNGVKNKERWVEDGTMRVEASLQLRGPLILLKGQFFGKLGMKEAKGMVCCVSWPLRGPVETEVEEEAPEKSLTFSCEILPLQEAAPASAERREAHCHHHVRTEAAARLPWVDPSLPTSLLMPAHWPSSSPLPCPHRARPRSVFSPPTSVQSLPPRHLPRPLDPLPPTVWSLSHDPRPCPRLPPSPSRASHPSPPLCALTCASPRTHRGQASPGESSWPATRRALPARPPHSSHP